MPESDQQSLVTVPKSPQPTTHKNDEPRSQQRVRTRRKRYLETHPEYFSSPDRELADPLLYDKLIRRFQSPAEREADRRKKGYAGMLEADLQRGEAKIAARPRPDGHKLEQDDEVPDSKAEGWERWKGEMELRFVHGEDEDFDYEAVDEDEALDDREFEERLVEERWFDQEEEEFLDEHDAKRQLQGETGVLDY